MADKNRMADKNLMADRYGLADRYGARIRSFEAMRQEKTAFRGLSDR